MDTIKYIVLCKASGEHFTFTSLGELLDYLSPEGELHPDDYHADLKIFKVAEEFYAVPKDKVTRPLVKTWMLRSR